jgi:hypothetical protein
MNRTAGAALQRRPTEDRSRRRSRGCEQHEEKVGGAIRPSARGYRFAGVDVMARGGSPRGADAGVAPAMADAGVAPAITARPAPPMPATPAPAKLKYSTVTKRTNDGCGGFHWAVQWGMDNAKANTNGFIVQELVFDLQRVKCDGTRDDFFKRYWEAWEVRGGSIFVGTSTTPHSADTFRVLPTPDRRGMNFEQGKAKFIPDYQAPLTWGNVPEAGSLPATETRPAGWNDSGIIDRYIVSRFDCCGGKTSATVWGEG